MTTTIKEVLEELDKKITEVYNSDLAEEMTDIYNDLANRINELSTNYWKLVKSLAKVKRNRNDLLEKYNKAIKKNRILRRYNEKVEKERNQAEYDRDHYRNELNKEHM